MASLARNRQIWLHVHVIRKVASIVGSAVFLVIAPGFVAGMPANYRDNLPERLARFKESNVPPRRLAELTYEDAETWLKGPPELRRPLMQRMRARAQDPEFRKAVIANMRFHPEWDRILFPEKYLPKEPPSATTLAPGQAPSTTTAATPTAPPPSK